MDIFDHRPAAFRMVFAVLAACMLTVTVVSIFRYASSATDENVFQTSPSDLYITRSMPADFLQQLELISNDPSPAVQVDSLLTGDLILSINDRNMRRPETIQKFIQQINDSTHFEIIVFRPSITEELVYRVLKRDFPDTSFRDIPSTVFVLDITVGGASDRAGLKIGDLIFRINSQRFKDQGEAQKILAEAQSGNALAYDVIRNNQNLTLTITLAEAGIRLSALMLISSGLLCMAFGIFIAISRPEFKAARLLGICFIGLGFFLANILPTITDRFQQYDNFTLFREIFNLICIFYCFPLWMHMAHYFPIEREELLKRPWIRYGSYALATAFLILLITSDNYIFLASGCFILAAFNIIPIFFRKERSDDYKKFNRIIYRTSLFVLGITIALFLVRILYGGGPNDPDPPLLHEFFRGYFGILLMLIPLAYLFTIGHYRLLNLDMRVKRNVQYNVITFAWGVMLLALLIKLLLMLPKMNMTLPNIKFEGSFIEVLDQPISDADRVPMEKLAVIFLGIVSTWGLWRIKKFGQQLIDQKFDRAQFDYRRAASELAEVMAAQFTMETLAKGIVHKLANIMQVKSVGILFFRKEQECCCSEIHGLSESRWQTFYENINTHIVKVLQTNRSDYRFSVDYLPDDIQVLFEQNGFKHIITIRSKEKLVGVLLIGEKRSETPFHKDDLTFLAAVAKQASIAIENAFLYEGLAEQERLRHELNIARRIQLASLPQTTPQIPGLEIAGISIPAQEVGGDYYDYLNGTTSDLTIIIGDVSGKGTSAALYMSKIQGIMRSLNDFGLSPRDLLIRANQLLIRDLEKQAFITVLGAAFDASQKVMQLARAGHSPLYHYCAQSESVELHTPKGIGLGLTSSEHFANSLEELKIPYRAGDIFLFITDGITEAQNIALSEYGDNELRQLMHRSNGHSAKRLRDQIITAVNHFAGEMPQHDDLTVVVVKAV